MGLPLSRIPLSRWRLAGRWGVGWRAGRQGSLAGQLPVEAGESNGEGLQGAQWVPVIEGEGVFRHAAEL